MKNKIITIFLLLLAEFGFSQEGGSTMNLDKQTKDLLIQLNESPIPMTEIPIPELRQMFPPPPSPQLPGIATIQNRSIPNTDAKIRIYTPKKKGPLPTFIFIHGGGWALGSLDDYDSWCQEIAAQSGCLLIAIDYPLAPEHPFPRPAQVCYSATRWIAENIRELGGLPDQISIGGDSAGANLAAAVLLMAREKQTPFLSHQLFICPALNYNFETASYFEFSDGYFLTKSNMEFFWNIYLQKPENGQNPLASPLKAKSLSGLPPASLLITDFDPLRDDGVGYAARLRNEGIPVNVKHLNTIHGFYRFPQLDINQTALRFISDELKAAFKEK